MTVEINTDGWKATVMLEPDGGVLDRRTLLFTDPDFLDRDIDEKVRMIREARSRILRERFDSRRSHGRESGVDIVGRRKVDAAEVAPRPE